MRALWTVAFAVAMLVLPTELFADADVEDEQRAVRFRDPAGTWLVMPYAMIPSLTLDVETPENRQVNDNAGDYEPNTDFQFGVRAVYDGWALTIGSGATTVSDEEKGKTRISDFGAAHYTKRFGIYGRMQNYRGMYAGLGDDDTDDDDAEYVKRPDIVMNNAELNAIYIFDPTSFSLKAAFDQGEIQTASGGSLLAMVSLQRVSVKSEQDLLVPDAAQVLGPGAPTGLTQAAATTLSILPGYGYTRVLPEAHYFTLAMHIGGGIQQRASELDGQTKNEWGTGMKVALQVSLGRNADDYLYGFSMNYLSTSARFQGVAVDVTSLPVTFFGGVRL